MRGAAKTVLITGCSSGFGRDLVTLFLERGWRVIATMRNAAERRDVFLIEEKTYPTQLRVLSLDVTSAEDRVRVLNEVSKDGRLDCLVNNAGYGLFGAHEDTEEQALRAVMETNFFGVALMIRDFLPLLRNSRGRVINISSAAGVAALPLTSGYSASKFAVEGLSEALRYELEPHGVQVALVEPGAFNTEFAHKSVDIHRDSIYGGAERAYERLREKIARLLPKSTRSVTHAVLKLATRKRMPLRTRCGPDARFVALARRILPAFVFHGLFTGYYRRAIAAR